MSEFTFSMLLFKLKLDKCEKNFFYSIFGFYKLQIKFYDKTNIGIVSLVKKYIEICMLDVLKNNFSSTKFSDESKKRPKSRGVKKIDENCLEYPLDFIQKIFQKQAKLLFSKKEHIFH